MASDYLTFAVARHCASRCSIDSPKAARATHEPGNTYINQRQTGGRHRSTEAKVLVTKTKSSKSVTIFCDGSSLGNGQAATRAAAVAMLGYQGVWRAVGAYLGHATNQQAEIVAAALGLESLKEPCRVHLFTDSRYVVETMSGRFRRKTNHDWWQRLDQATSRHDVKWEWLRGHDGHLVQEAADRAARKIAGHGQVDEEILRDAVDRVGAFDPAEIAAD